MEIVMDLSPYFTSDFIFTLPNFCACSKSFVVAFFYVQWVKVRVDCLFYWYWWNCWPSPFNFLFIKVVSALFFIIADSINNELD
jgi:hypothetical protein